ncbi:MAG: response regulator [Oscillospiraceae bacterium]|nr:response regulator [Oscillospiraceae bacterium]
MTGNIMRRWELNGGHGIRAEFASEFVNAETPDVKKTADIQIAVVDDDDTNLRVAGTVLSKAGFRVSAMRSGRSLLKYLTDRSPDLILLDVQMPDMDGFETMRMLRRLKNGASVPVVFLSAADDENTERTGMQLGAEDFIEKPFLPELLIQRVRRITELSAFRSSSAGRTNG